MKTITIKIRYRLLFQKSGPGGKNVFQKGINTIEKYLQNWKIIFVY